MSKEHTPESTTQKTPSRAGCTVSRSTDGYQAVVTFYDLIGRQSWDRLRQKITQMLDDGYRKWEFDLLNLPICTSEAVGMLLSMNALIESRQSRVIFRVASGSSVFNVIGLMNLDKILKVQVDACSLNPDARLPRVHSSDPAVDIWPVD